LHEERVTFQGKWAGTMEKKKNDDKKPARREDEGENFKGHHQTAYCPLLGV